MKASGVTVFEQNYPVIFVAECDGCHDRVDISVNNYDYHAWLSGGNPHRLFTYLPEEVVTLLTHGQCASCLQKKYLMEGDLSNEESTGKRKDDAESNNGAKEES